MEFIDTIIGAGIAWLAFRTGVRRERKRKSPGAICGCKHHRSFHVDGEGSCQHNGWDPCACQKYHGPRTLDDLIPED